MKDNKIPRKEKEEYIPKHAHGYIQENNYITNQDKVEIKKNNIKSCKVKRKRRRLKKWVWNLIIAAFLMILIIGIINLILWNKDNNKTSDVVDEINKDISVKEKEDDLNTEMVGDKKEEKTSDYWYYIKFPLIDVDFTKLKEKNSDTIGWINVNNTNINYPYVQYKDNNYYLTHSFDKSYNEAGWVFMDYRNNSNFNNKNTIIYAHSRLDKTMFGSLSKVLKYDWYTNKDNHIIRIATEKESSLWQIFSVYKIKEESYYITTNFQDDEEYSKFLNTIRDRSIYSFNTNLSSEDKVLTLSTCYSDTERTVVHAKLIKKSSR